MAMRSSRNSSVTATRNGKSVDNRLTGTETSTGSDPGENGSQARSAPALPNLISGASQ